MFVWGPPLVYGLEGVGLTMDDLETWGPQVQEGRKDRVKTGDGGGGGNT